MSAMRTKSVERKIHRRHRRARVPTEKSLALDLTIFGVGVVIGAGNFTLTGRAATRSRVRDRRELRRRRDRVRPGGDVLRRVRLDGPGVGSAYTFSVRVARRAVRVDHRVDLILEMLLGASVVAQGWSAYLGALMAQLGAPIPAEIGYGGTVI